MNSHRFLNSSIDIKNYDQPLRELLELKVNDLHDAEKVFLQINCVHQEVEALGCQSVAIENHYIDRDYIEEHSHFYSKSLYPYDNWCRRVHFFSLNETQLKAELSQVRAIGHQNGENEYRRKCREFSDEHYLGFSVIKPLSGSPVGRTVLKCPKLAVPGDKRWQFDCIRSYKVHLAGIELTINGLAFQQQDVGVSACATTALWSSLQKTREFDEIFPATPAQITLLATQRSLPFGRPMPSEGLTVDQMCQVVQALGASPVLFRAQNSTETIRLLYSAITSGFAPVLIISSDVPDTAGQSHAVTVTGMEINSAKLPGNKKWRDGSEFLSAVFVHDDRLGPYLRAPIGDDSKTIELSFEKPKYQKWKLTHLLIPMHAKIRLSFTDLQSIASKIIGHLEEALRVLAEKSGQQPSDSVFELQIRILQAHKYHESLFLGSPKLSLEDIEKFNQVVTLSKYVGLVRINHPAIGELDVVVDTTSPLKNLHCLVVVARKIPDDYPHTSLLAEYLAEKYDCRVIA